MHLQTINDSEMTKLNNMRTAPSLPSRHQIDKSVIFIEGTNIPILRCRRKSHQGNHNGSHTRTQLRIFLCAHLGKLGHLKLKQTTLFQQTEIMKQNVTVLFPYNCSHLEDRVQWTVVSKPRINKFTKILYWVRQIKNFLEL